MFSIEKFAANILTKYLGNYVEGLEEKNLQISLLKGSAQLSNLKLKKEALDGLELPVTVKSGHLGEVELSIPWKNLKFEQASLRIKGVYIEAGPKEEKDELSSEEKVIATKRRILQLAELVGMGDVNYEEAKNSDVNLSKNTSYLATITDNVVNNIQLFIDDVYVRYIEKDLDFDFGIRFQKLHAQSTDFFWKPKVITQSDVKDKLFYKLIQLTQFSVFWNTNDFNNRLKKDEKSFENILSPVDINVHVIINKNEVLETTQPKFSVECMIPNIHVNFNENQYKELLFIIETFSNYRKSMNYLHLRPSVGSAKGHPLHWWKYAISGASYDIKKKQQKSSWLHFLRLLKDKKKYILLFAKKKVFESEKLSLTKEEYAELESIEYQFDVDSIINYRNLGSLLSKRIKEDRKKKKEELMKKQWFGKMFNPAAMPYDEVDLTPEETHQLEAQLSALSITTQSVLPKNYIQYKVDFTLQKSEITIRDHYLSKIMSFSCSYLAIDCLLRSGGGKFSLDVQSFNIFDHFTSKTLFPQVLFSQDDESHSEPIIRTVLDLNPIDKDVDIDLEIMLSSVILVFPRQLLLRTFQFFALPLFERQSRSLEMLALEKLQEFKSQATQQIKDLFNTAKKITLTLKIPSPKILIPQNTQDILSPLLIIDLGYISFQNSDVLSPTEMDSIYSTYLLSLTDTNAHIIPIQTFLSDMKKNSNKFLYTSEDQFRLVENCQLESKIEICRFQSPIFPLLRITASLSSFCATISESTSMSLLLILDDIISSLQVIDQSFIKISEIQLLSEISKIKAQQLQLAFSVEKVEVKIIEDNDSSEILKIRWNNFGYRISQSNHNTTFDATLSSAYIVDSYHDKSHTSYLFTSEIEESGASGSMIKTLTDLKGQEDCMISIKYNGYPENSPLFKDCCHEIAVEFNSIHFFTHLDTVERLLLFFDKVVSGFLSLRTPTFTPSALDFLDLEATSSPNLLKIAEPAIVYDTFTLYNLKLVLHSVGFSIPMESTSAVVEGVFGRSEVSVLAFPSGDHKSSGQIGKATIDYKEAREKGFPHILEIEGDNLVKFEIHRSSSRQNISSVSSKMSPTISFKFDVDEMKFYYFHSLFVLLQKNLTAIREQEYSLRSSMSSQPKTKTPPTTLINYEFNIQHPCIIVPTFCDGFVEGFCVNLGLIAIKNRIFSLSPDQISGEEDDVLKEEVTLHINNFFLESYHSPEILEPYLRYLVENTSVNIVVNKNYQEKAGKDKVWEVKSTIPNFSANLTRYNISLLRHILDNNFLSDHCLRILKAFTENGKPVSNVESALSIFLTCDIAKSSIKIYNGDGIQANRIFSEKNREGRDQNMDNKSTSLLLLQTSRTLFSFVSQKDQTSIEISTIHFTVDDIRSSHPQPFTKICTPIINNLIRKQNVIQSSIDDVFRDQFYLKFRSSKNQPNTIDVTIENHFIVVMEAWVEIFAFIVVALPEIGTILSQVFMVLDPSTISDPTPLHIKLKFPKPDICVVHNPNDKNTEAFLVRGAVSIDLLSEPLIKSNQIKVLLSEFEVFKSTMNSMSSIKCLVEKSNVELMYHDVTDTSIIYSISVTSPIQYQFSFRDYTLLLNLFNTWTPLFAYLWRVKESSYHSGQIDGESQVNINQRLNLSCIGGSILLINDLDTSEHERALLTLVVESFKMSFCNWSSFDGKNMELVLNTIFKVDYLNYKLEMWEAMLEATKIELELLPDQISTRKITGYIENFNFNISCYFIDSVLNLFQAWSSFNDDKKIEHSYYHSGENKRDLLQKSRNLFSSFSSPIPQNLPLVNEEEVEGRIYPYYLRNDCGVKIIYGVTDNASTQPKNVYFIPPNVETPLIRNLDKNLNLLKLAEAKNDEEIAFTDRIPIDKIGRYKTRIGAKDHFYITTCEVSHRKGSKLITIRSNRLFINSSHNPIFICLKSVDKEDLIYKINHGQTISIPITYINQYSEFCITTNFDSHNYTKSVSFSGHKELYYLTTIPKSNRSIPSCLIMKYYRQDCDHIFEIFPSLIFQNALPVPVNVFVVDPNLNDSPKKSIKYSVEAESTLSLHEVALNIDRDVALFFEVTPFGRSLYPANISISFAFRSSEHIVQFNDEVGNIFSLRVNYTTKNHIRKVVIYSDFWILNKTSLNVFYQVSGSNKNDLLPGQTTNKEPTSSPFLLYTPTSKFLQFQRPKLALKVQQSNWSEGFSVEREGVSTPISLEDSSTQYELLVLIKNATNFYWRTKEVTIYPKYVLVNQTLDTLYYSQPNNNKVMKVDANNYTQFHWLDVSSPKQLVIKFSEDQSWSSPFNLSLDNFSLKVRNKENNSQYLLYSVSISLDNKGISTVIAISYQIEPEYLIQNQTPFTFSFCQKLSINSEIVKPKQTTSFTLDLIHENEILCITAEGGTNTLEVPLDQFVFGDNEFEIGNEDKNVVKWNFILGHEGKAKVLVLKTEESPLNITLPFAAIKLQIETISISLIDERPQEIILISLCNISVNSEIVDDEIDFDLSLQLIQIDNQLPNSPFPVLLQCLNPNNANFFHAIGSLRTHFKSVLYLNSFQLHVQPIDIRLDEEIIVRLLEFSKDITQYLEKRNKVLQIEDEYKEIANSTKTQPKLISLYFNTFKISSLELSVSFKSDAASADEEFNRLLPAYLRLLVNFENSSLTFDELYTTSITCLPSELIGKLSTYYSISFKNKLYALLSSDLIGNPKGLVSNIGVGFYDFFHEPTYAVVNSPTNIGYGFARGTKSLVLNSLYAISNTTSKLSDSLASGVATATFDSEFQRERDWSKARDKPQHIGEGAAQGIISLGRGIFQGLTGVITEPIKGSQDGASGVLRGIVKGTTGLIVKPTIGVLDSVAKLSEGVKNNTSIEYIPQRMRLPRHFGRDKVLLPYDEEQAKNQYILQTCKGGKYAREFLQACFPLNENLEKLMITDQHLLIVRTNYVTWEANMRFIRNINIDECIITIAYSHVLHGPLKAISFQPYFPIPLSPNVRKFECGEIRNQLLSLVSLLKFNCD